MWWYNLVVVRGGGVVGMEWDGLEWLLRLSLVLMVGRDVDRLRWGLNGGWMGALGMGSLERVGGFCCVGGWRVGMLLRGVDGGIVGCGCGWEGLGIACELACSTDDQSRATKQEQANLCAVTVLCAST